MSKLSKTALIYFASLTGCASNNTEPGETVLKVPAIVLNDFATPIPEAIQYGQFKVFNGCLTLQLGAREFTPVFVGKVPSYQTQSSMFARVNSSRIPINATVTIGGGSMPANAIEPALSNTQRITRCRADYFVISR